MKRVIVVGITGSGKSTMARKLAAKIGGPAIDLDEFHWLPGWKERTREDFRRLVEEAARGEKWVIAGNYTTHSRDITWPRADTLIWLDMPFFANFWHLLERTFRRIRMGESICNGNKEKMGMQLLTKNSIFWWFFKSWGGRRKKFGDVFADPSVYPHLKLIRLRSYQESAAFIGEL